MPHSSPARQSIFGAAVAVLTAGLIACGGTESQSSSSENPQIESLDCRALELLDTLYADADSLHQPVFSAFALEGSNVELFGTSERLQRVQIWHYGETGNRQMQIWLVDPQRWFWREKNVGYCGGTWDPCDSTIRTLALGDGSVLGCTTEGRIVEDSLLQSLVRRAEEARLLALYVHENAMGRPSVTAACTLLDNYDVAVRLISTSRERLISDDSCSLLLVDRIIERTSADSPEATAALRRLIVVSDAALSTAVSWGITERIISSEGPAFLTYLLQSWVGPEDRYVRKTLGAWLELEMKHASPFKARLQRVVRETIAVLPEDARMDWEDAIYRMPGD